MRRMVALVLCVAAGCAAVATPVVAAERVFSGLVPTTFLQKWSANLWQVWAKPGGECLELVQYPDETPFRFWGFRQWPGSRVDMMFGSIGAARPGKVQMSFNDGDNFDYAATVERQADWDAYVISLQPDALSIFQNDTFVDAYVDGEKVFWSVTHTMRNGEKLMAKCLDWQRHH